ncbi:MAG: 7-cyano-7-deazaguanine synthase QueC [Oceanococcus sp.]|nr:MAG: 7-cyano-7-deazaguanine synthase QueC [Oceanococcus sp.]
MNQDIEHAPRDAVILLSGGLDSATVLAMAQAQGFRCHALSISYGQRHVAELEAARALAEQAGCLSYRRIEMDMRLIGGSALTDPAIEVPTTPSDDIPITYVPARNTVFLSLAMGLAEVLGAQDLFIGVNAVDYSGYPDCRPAFLEQFQKLSQLATKAGVESGQGLRIHAPLLHMSKGKIIRQGIALGVDYAATVSCYQADDQGRACGVCDSCRLRQEGFVQAGVNDPTRYISAST